ncbi:MAG: PTS sugar transporter subunit IIB [Flexistipes sinusarabici]|uniref:PTS sugar transporter subunit IIB n=1 Tax=Flexistipes sinusarabici TaxID=2352 RepID=A0A5D0MHY2_FLESI|nr:PTS sugar transporter subunit IIB [Flexistipes sinusarabici]TYB33314.1 MAG: PTS sugar transporter subunit IIB [Flexistipes sinusarabici]
MNKKIIFRVDDRLIHGQVIEGWIKYYKINDIIIVSDRICSDYLQKMIYSSILPASCTLQFYCVDDFIKNYREISSTKNSLLVLFESVNDLYRVRDILNDNIFVNIGCVASREHKIEITDTVFLDKEEVLKLSELRDRFNIFVKKLPWETAVEIKNFINFLED